MSQNIRDIQHSFRGRGQQLERAASGGTELAYMRGFQAGYEQAVKDQKRGRLNPDNALLPHRGEPRTRRR